MKKHSHFLMFLIIAASIGAFFVMKPFLLSIFLGFILATMFSGTNKKLAKKLGKHKAWSSALMCLWVMIVLIIPFLIAIGLMANEANAILKDFQVKNALISFYAFIDSLPFAQSLNLSQYFQIDENFAEVTKVTQNLVNYLFAIVGAIYRGASNLAFVLLVSFFALYYFFKDGKLILKKIMEISPLPSSQERDLFEKFNTMTIATIKGTLIIALVQGILMGITFWITGVQAPTLWAFITALISIIPLLGAVLVWLPVGIVMLFLGYYWQGIVILLFGAIVISSVDNFLRPKLIEGETSLHPLLVFLSTLGGIALFGPLGFVVGPVLITSLLSLLEIYRTGHVQNLKRDQKA